MASKKLDTAITVVACAMGLYHLAFTQVLFTSPKEHQNFHLMFLLVLLFLVTFVKKPNRRPLMAVLIAASLLGTGWVALNFADLEMRAGFPVPADLVIGSMLILLAMEACRQAYGPIIPVVAIIFLVYLFLGQHLPEPFYHAYLNPQTLLSWLGVGFNGIYGMSLAVSANYLFLFMVFGGIIRAANMGPLFLEAGKLLGRRLRGGAAQTAVVSSALVGTVTGSAVANVPVTGSMTIPMMKSVGYKPEVAGAIEATAGSGGQIMPPVMGASAFMMAGLTGIPYYKICIAAAIPAVLYFLSVGIYIELKARRTNIAPMTGAVDKGVIARKLSLFVVPFLVLVVFFLQGHTPMYVAFWAVIATITTTYVTSLFTKERPPVSHWVKGFSEGVIDGAKIGATSAVLGMVIASIILTGLGMKLSAVVADVSQGNIWIAAVITMFVSLVIGCGVPTMPAYVLVAILIAPALAKMGTSVIAAHLFCIYFAVFSAVTPPVAVAALVAAQIAGAPYIKTALEATKIGIIAFIIPYVFLSNPAFILQSSDIPLIVSTFLVMALALVPIGALLTQQYFTRLNWWEMMVSGAAGIVLVLSAITKSYPLMGAGALLVVVLTFAQWRRARAVSAVMAPVPGKG